MKRVAVPRLKPTKPGAKYRYKLVYPNGYVKYVRYPEQLPKEVSNPRDKQRLEQTNTGFKDKRIMQQTARELLKIARSLL